MTHVDEDMLLKFELETLDAVDAARIRDHLLGCPLCRELRDILRIDIAKLSAIEMHLSEVEPPPLRKRSQLLVVVSRIAATLVVGFLTGYLAAETLHPVRPLAVQQRLVPSQLAVPVSGHVVCQAIDINGVR